MTSLKSILFYTIVTGIIIQSMYSCAGQNSIGIAGVLKGKITIGPLCPVETVPPSPGCSPTADTYKTWATAVWKLNKTGKVVTLTPALDGNYLVTLPSGKYIIDFDSIQNYKGGSNLPNEITVSANDTVIFNINIDTGIR
jgi:hypothetical protein